METTIAILMADLSGYTALTEIHGAQSAVDIVNRYMSIVNRSLVGDSYLHQRVGDQVVIISTSAEQLAYTATILFDRAHQEESFLPLHAGLHFGPIIKKENDFYGSTINTTSRIMNAADKGKMYCSVNFMNELPKDHSFAFNKKGPYQFKNILQPIELFELDCCIQNISKSYVIDPVCHMLIKYPEKAIQLKEDETIHYFCSEKCRNIYTSIHQQST